MTEDKEKAKNFISFLWDNFSDPDDVLESYIIKAWEASPELKERDLKSMADWERLSKKKEN